VTKGDFDGDGRLDVAAGNLGLNTGGLWQPSRGKRRLWWSEEGGRVRLIETHEEEGEEWALAWWDRLKEGISPRVAAAASYAQFAERSAEELFGDLEERGFEALELAEWRSGVFWQRADGSFEFEALPTIGQSGRAVSLLAEDFDGDGLSDLIVSLEPPSLAPWTGRAERGHLAFLLGRPEGKWEVELPWTSGLDIDAASPRDLLWADFDGDGDEELAVALAEGKPLLFEKLR